MAYQQTGDTAKLVGAMMRLRHNTTFKSGLKLGGAPSSVAPARDHLEFLQACRRQIRQQEEDAEEDDEVAGNGDMVTAKFAETQIRALVNAELEACLVLHESQDFWQQRVERSGGKLRNWIEMGPLTWSTHSLDSCCEEYLGRLSRCRKMLRIKILSVGSLQLHLTKMKQAYIEDTLAEWNEAALTTIRTALESRETARRINTNVSSNPRRPSTAASPSASGRSLGEAYGRVDVATGRRGQSLFRRAASFARINSWVGDLQGAEEENDERDAGAVQNRNKPACGSLNGDGDEKVEVARADLVGLLADEPQEGRLMEALLVTSEQVIADVGAQQEAVPLLVGNAAPPSRLRRNWSLIAVATPAVLATAFFMYTNRSGIRRSLFMVRGSLRQFVREHISEPFWGIYNELVHNQPLTMTDANALADSSLSLERMLEAFIKDTRPELPLGEVKRMAATKDMSVVSREYETSITSAWKNLVAGDIARMMLIQVQFIKRELLIATTAIGQLARENELNLRMMATVPAFLLAWGSFRAVRPVYYLLKSEKSRDSTFTAMRTIVLAMERLLNLRHREGTWLQLTEDVPTGDEIGTQAGGRTATRRGSLVRPAGHSDNCTSQVIVSAGQGQGRMAVRVLDELDLGKLMMLIHQLRRLIRSGPRRFKRRDLTDCKEDLAELVGERGLVSVGQQLAIAQRMQRSYHFLLPSR